MKSPSLGNFTKIPLDKYYSIDPKIGNTLHMDLVDETFTYCEPCCGGGDLMSQIKGDCVQAIDISPEKTVLNAEIGDARFHPLKKCDYIISNPPFSKEYKSIFHEMLRRFLNEDVKAIFMLLPMNWQANSDFQWAMEYCESVRPTGRLKWFDDGKGSSDTKDHAWFKFVTLKTDTIVKPRHATKRMTNREYIMKANLTHDYKYEYLFVDVLNFKEKIRASCPIHGTFEIEGHAHLDGRQCQKCRDIDKSTRMMRSSEQIQKQLCDKYGGKITLVEENGKFPQDRNVKFNCDTHGINESSVKNLIRTGCKLCNDSDRIDDLRNELKENIEGSDYGLVSNMSEVSHRSDYITLNCPKHNRDFQNNVRSLLRGFGGCKLCQYDKIKINKEEFISRALIHHENKYEYDESTYVSMSDEMDIICPEHGDFRQTPLRHLQTKGCPKCTHANSDPEKEWLEFLNIESLQQQYRINHETSFYKVDGYDPVTNTVYEFLGDYWHGNIALFDYHPDELHPQKKFTTGDKKGMRMTMSDLYIKTMTKLNHLEKLGYNVVYIWETDWNKMKEIANEL